MSPVLLVAAREYKQVASTRAFWISLLLLPVVIVLSLTAARYFAPGSTWAYTIIDPAGTVAPAVDRQVEVNYQRQMLSSLSAYATRWNVKGAEYLSSGDVDAFINSGGKDAVLKAIKPQLPPTAPEFSPPARPWVRIASPVSGNAEQ